MINKLKQIFNECTNKQQLIEQKNIFIKKEVEPLLKQLKTCDPKDKKALGMKLKAIQNDIENLFNEYLTKFETTSSFNFILNNNELGLNVIDAEKGTKHIINQIIDEVYKFFSALDFEIIIGDEITSNKYNFDNLNISLNHPARVNNDSLYINENLLLRTHCTSSTAKLIENNNNDDIRIVTVGNVYRNDDDDATHSHQFTQLDMVWISKDISLANLKWLVDKLLQHLFSKEIKIRYRLSYFPFTEPSFEVDIGCFKCEHGCDFCKHTGWIEIMGAGVLHPNVLSYAYIDDKQGIAAGIGLERLVMLKYEFNDIRLLYNNQYSINKQFKK